MFRGFRRWHARTEQHAAPLDPNETDRERMIALQLSARGITDARVLNAMRAVPRHLFVPEANRQHAYEDHPLDIGAGQTISQPYMVAVMTQLLALSPGDNVLEIGTGSGYQTAILASLVRHVTSVERIAALAERAEETLSGLEYRNVSIHVGDGTLGWPRDAPYDAIIVTAAGPSTPVLLKDQLSDGGRLLCPVGSRNAQQLIRIVRNGTQYREDAGVGCVFVPLIGADGWPD